ncbi:MAG: class I SAM-dependent methyltransferase [archaeon]|nr:MAG: class I SAM-dependent methyltransferase [archaeon]
MIKILKLTGVVMNLDLWEDAKIDKFVESLLVRGYSNYNIPEEIPKKIVSSLQKSKSIKDAAKDFYSIPEIKNENSSFWKGRKKYSSGKARYHEEMKFIGNLNDKKVLEIGCGSGNLAYLISKKYKIKKYIATDLSPPGKEIDNVEFLKQGNKTEIPVEDSSVDSILIMDMLHHVNKNQQRYLIKNAKNKLNENGKIVFFEYTFSEEKEPLYRSYFTEKFNELSKKQKFGCMEIIDYIGNILVNKSETPMPNSYRTMEEWEDFFKKLELKINNSEYIGFPKRLFHQGPYGIINLSL